VRNVPGCGKKLDANTQPLKGTSDFEECSASLKRCPDTKPDFFRGLCGALPRWTAEGGRSYAITGFALS
jgi:hypothetical protein